VNVRRSIAVAVLAAAVPALSSCGVNFGAQTDKVYNAAVGVDDRSGQVNVLNALIVSGVDGSGTVVAGLVNKDANKTVHLTGITSGDPSKPLTVTGPTTAISGQGMVSLADKGQYSVHGKSVVAGRFVKLTFTFDDAKTITVDVPVELASDPDYKNVPLPKG